MHRPGLFNVHQLKNISLNLTPGKIQLENIPFLQTGLLERMAYVPNHLLYLISLQSDGALSCKYMFLTL